MNLLLVIGAFLSHSPIDGREQLSSVSAIKPVQQAQRGCDIPTNIFLIGEIRVDVISRGIDYPQGLCFGDRLLRSPNPVT